MPNLAGFLSYILLTAFTPGPNNIMSMSNSGKYGLKNGLRFCLGVLLGFIGVMGACAVFTALLFQFIPKIQPVMRYIGAAYILWLAWTVYRDKAHEKKKTYLHPSSVLTGMVLQFVNVKVILYGITSFSTFILPFDRSVPMLALFAGILCITGFIACSCWALFGSAFQKLFTAHKKAVNISMALLLLYCAAAILFEA